jgi:lycopene cyclase domain-containing protein
LSHFLYILIDVLSISLPLAFSFYPKANFSRKWRYLFPGMTIIAVAFIGWDMAFTSLGVWGFNPTYVLGPMVYNLPIEEVLFFICIPYSSLYLYEAINHFIKRDHLRKVSKRVSIILIILLATVALANITKRYTCITFIACAVTLAFTFGAEYMGRFYLSFLFILIPFSIVNGTLTGGFTDQPVVWYNEADILGYRLGTIPVEDVFYGMLLLLINVVVYENLQKSFLNGLF